MFDLEKQIRWSKIKVGLVITLALLILCLTVLFAGNIGLLFSPKVDFRVQFHDIKGLRKGAPVWLFGTEVGSVKNIALDPIYGTIVTISVTKRIQGLIKRDSHASIMTMGLLGDKYMELTAGSPVSPPLKPGELIKGASQIEFTDIVETSASVFEKMSDFLKRMDVLMSKIEEGQGTVGKFLSDPAIYNNLKTTTQDLSAVAQDLRNSRGTFRMLIEDETLYSRLSSAASSIDEFTRKLNESSGTLKRMMEDPSLYEKLVAAASSIEGIGKSYQESSGTLKKIIEDPSLYERLVSASSSIETFAKKLNESEGTLKRLLEDRGLYDNLDRGSQQLASILSRVDRGEGVAGTLIRDDEMAAQMKETVVKIKELTQEVENLARDLEELTKDIKANPRKYFKFSVF
jgi:phospholipid/cholesterol/gamma-HCH transport system substrate-binding protein